MPFIVILILICGSAFVTVIEAGACDYIWGLLVASHVQVDLGVAAWFGMLVIWGLMTYDLQRSKQDSNDALEGRVRWDVVRAYAIIQGRRLTAIGFALVAAAGMRLVMGW